MGQVVIHHKVMPFDVVIREYSIVGDMSGELCISREVVPEVGTDAKRFKFCGYNFLVMEYQPWSYQFRVRIDTRYAYAIRIIERIGRLLRDINCRLVLTAYVWGLQDRPRDGEVIRRRRKQ